jgi:diacylglycerol kinase (ATP)
MTSEHIHRKHVCIIHNPTAGQRSGQLLDRCLKQLQSLGVEFDLVPTQKAGHAKSLAREAAQNSSYEAVIVAGGDGSLNEAANGLLGLSTPMGIIPTGTANVLATEIGLSSKASDIARTIAYGPTIKAFPGMMNENAFLLMVSAGFDAKAIKNLPSRLKKLLGKGAYFLSALRELLKYDPQSFTVALGEKSYQANWVIVSRSRYYAGKFLLTSEVDLRSKEYAVFLFNCRSRLELLMILLRLVQTRFMKVSMEPIMTTEEIVMTGQGDVQVDGDLAGQVPITINPLSPSLNLIMPPA